MRCFRFASLALVLALSLALPARAAEDDGWLVPRVTEAPAFSDTAGAWCEAEVSTVCEAGLMEGRSADCFAPRDTLMPEHVVAVCARLYSLLTGGDGAVGPAAEGEAWYQPYYDYLAESLDYTGGSEALMLNFHATKYPAKRWHFAQILYQTLEAAEAELPVLNQVSVVPDSTDPAVLALYRAGILTGNDPYGTFDGNGTLNRGQAAAILARLADPSLRQTFTLKSFDLCADVLGLEPETVVLTVGGAPVTAAEFANDLCTALHQAGGGSRTALDSAIHTWCFYTAPFQVLAEEKGVSLTEEELDQTAQYAAGCDGYLGLDAAYWQCKKAGVLLNSKLNDLYWQADWKTGTAYYHQDLDKTSRALLEGAVIEPALVSLDLTAVYRRLEASPFILWNFL